MTHESIDEREGIEVERLLERAAAGDAEAFRGLMEMHRDRLRRMVAVRLDRRIASRVDPSDVVQETLAEAAAGLGDYTRLRPLPFYPWLRQIAFDRMVAMHRRHVRAAARDVRRERAIGDAPPGLPDESALALADRLVADGTSPSRRASRDELRGLVRRAIDSLSDTDREILVLRHLEGLPTAEIATLLGISAEAVRARHVRAVEHLRRRLGPGALE